jgi:hypothetical protein
MTTAPDPSQPTVYEMIRTVSRQMDEQRQATSRLEGTVQMLVTQDQRRADADLNALRFGTLEQRVVSSEEKTTWARRMAVTGLGIPLMLAVLGYLSGVVLTMPNA